MRATCVQLVALVIRGDLTNEVGILVLRHQIAVLRRQVAARTWSQPIGLCCGVDRCGCVMAR